MGLDTSHDCWHGAYSAFMTWRTKLASVAGLPPLELMEGFFRPLNSDFLPTLYSRKGHDDTSDDPLSRLDEQLPISWDCLKPDPLHELLVHSDCEGEIPWESCKGIADSLEKLLPDLPKEDHWGHIGNWEDKTKQFIDGLRDAYDSKENVDFH